MNAPQPRESPAFRRGEEVKRDHDTYERAAVRWIGRLALEGKDVALEDLQAAAAALAALPLRPDSAVASLTAICARCGAS